MNTKEKRQLLREARNLGFVDDGKPDRSMGVTHLVCVRGNCRLSLQIWDSGFSRVSHGTATYRGAQGFVGFRETTPPTDFEDLTGMYRAIAFEWQRESVKP